MNRMTTRGTSSENTKFTKERVAWGASGAAFGLALLLASGTAYVLSNSDSFRGVAVLISVLSAIAVVWVSLKSRTAALITSAVLAAAVIYGVATEVSPSRPDLDLSTLIYGATRGVLTPGLLGASLGALIFLSFRKANARSNTNGGKS